MNAGEIIGIISGVIAALSGVGAMLKWCKDGWHKNGRFLNEYRKHPFFFPMPLAKEILRRNVGEYPVSSPFVDYAAAVEKGYYTLDVEQIKIKKAKLIEEVKLPYKIIINYIEHPEAQTKIRESRIDGAFSLSDEYVSETQDNLEEFISSRPNTIDGPALRMKSMDVLPDGNFECSLQSTTYFNQVRTNLTIDFPLDAMRTMRTEDLSDNKTLKSFEESVLANTIGVSAMWMTPLARGRKKSSLQVFLKPRRATTGIYSDMLGTVSGVVEYPEGGIFNCASLEEYATAEILREFFQETGYDEYMKKAGVRMDDIHVIPLLFTRELVRGGKPQFFFLILTPSMKEKEIESFFKNSFNGKEEFQDGVLARFREFRMSPETGMNFLYALRYLQQNHYLGFVDLT